MTPQQVTSPGQRSLAPGKSRVQGLHWAVQWVMHRKGDVHDSGKALGVRSEAVRPGEEAAQVTDVTWRRAAGSPTLLASGEGSQFGRKFLEVRERVGYELNSSSYPPFTAKIEHLSQVPYMFFFPIAH